MKPGIINPLAPTIDAILVASVIDAVFLGEDSSTLDPGRTDCRFEAFQGARPRKAFLFVARNERLVREQ